MTVKCILDYRDCHWQYTAVFIKPDNEFHQLLRLRYLSRSGAVVMVKLFRRIVREPASVGQYTKSRL